MTNIILRILWVIFIGSWLMPIFYILGFIFTALIITAPIGMWFFNKIGFVFSLYEDPNQKKMTFTRTIGGILWFYFIGWWAGLLVVSLADALTATLIGIPLAWWLIDRLDKIVILN